MLKTVSGYSSLKISGLLTLNAVSSNGSVGTAGQLLTSNGTTTYWSTPAAASVNVAAQYVWTNTQTFSNTITFSSTINGTANNAAYLGGVAAASYVQNTDSRTLSGNLNFTGTNTFFTAGLRANGDIKIGTASSTETSGVAYQRFFTKTVAAGELYRLCKYDDTEGTIQLLITVSSETGAHSGTSTYLWQGGYNSASGVNGWYRLLPLNTGRGHGDGPDTGENSNAWNVLIYGNAVTGSSYQYGVAVSVPAGRTGKTLKVTVEEIKRGMTFTDESSIAVVTSWTIDGTFYSHRNLLVEGNVGISNTAPTHKLRVDGTTSLAGAVSDITTLAAGNTTITGFVNATSSVNAASHSVGTAFTANSTVVNAVSYYAGTLLVANSTVSNATHLGGQLPAYYTNATNITTGTLPYAQIPANVINTTAAFTRTGITTFSANVVLGSSGLSSNGGFGTAGEVLHSNGTATYWATDDQGVTSVATGNGMTGGTITATGTVSVLANTGIVANATGVFVNSAYIATIASNSATYANASISNTFTVGTTTYFVANGNLGVGTASPEYKLHVTGAFGFFNNGIRLGGGYSAIDVATGVSGLFLSGSQGALNHQFISPTGNVGIGNTAPTHKLSVNGDVFVNTSVAVGNSTVNVTVNSTIFTGTANNATYFGGYTWAAPAILGGTTANGASLTYANVSGQVNTATLYATTSANIASAVQANATGVWTTGTVNAASHTVGTAFTANSTVVNAVSYYAGTLLVANSTVSNATHLGGTAASGYQTTAGLSANVATLTSNNSTNFGGQLPAYYTNASNITTGTLAYAQIPANVINTTAAFTRTGITTFSANIVLGSSGVSANGGFGAAGEVLHSNGTATYWAADDQSAGVTSVATGNGMTGGTITATGTVSVLANTGIVANATGVFVNATYIGTLTSNNATNAFGKTEGALNVNNATTAYGKAEGALNVNSASTALTANNSTNLGGTAAASYQLNSTLSANVATLTANNSTNFGGQLPAYYTNATNITTGTLPYAQIPANVINTTAAFTRTGITTFSANVVLGSSGLSANGSFGTDTHVLHSNGTAAYWAADDQGVTSVATGNGMTGGTISTTGTVSVLANTGIVANATGTFVNASYIATISANNASFLGTVAAASYVQNTDSRTLSGNLVISGTSFTPSSNAILLGNSTQRWVLSANTGSFSGAVSGITTLAAGNTTITGFANVTTTIQGGSSLTIAGALSGVTTSAMGNTTVTGFVNATSSVNAASYTVGTAFTANSTVVNAVAYYAGTLLVANSTVSNATHLGGVAAASYVQNTDSRVLSGNLNFTGTNNFFSTGLFVGANVIANTTALFVGNSTANSTTNATAVTAHIQHASRPTLGFNYTVANTVNSLIVGPYAVNTGFTLTVETGARLVIV